ncbi:MAG: polyprenol monophosphomannose synthase [Actinomycetota bacterium]|nr:polyprenol monophosphomannose synthase [Actinomycetota bacterium]
MEASPSESKEGLPGAVALGSSEVWVVMPTYNEALNLETVVAAAREHLPAGSRILVVDDNSPDGTGGVADRLAGEADDLEVLHRTAKLGLGPAYVAGFQRVLEAGAGLVVQMDADFSHDPADLPRLLEAARDADVVIGSRYVKGGGVPDWGLRRRLMSRVGSGYAQLALGLPYRDLTGGYKVIRRDVLESIDLASTASHGYAFQVELTYRAARAGFRIQEVPIQFRERRAGKSKLSMRIVAEAAFGVPRMRLHRS